MHKKPSMPLVLVDHGLVDLKPKSDAIYMAICRKDFVLLDYMLDHGGKAKKLFHTCLDPYPQQSIIFKLNRDFAAVLQQGAHNAHEFVYIVKIMEYASLHKYYVKIISVLL